MSGQSVPDETSQADIRHVLAAKHGPGIRKGKTVKAHESATTPDSVTVANTTYNMNKGESVMLNGHHYSTPDTLVRYHICEHEFTSKEMALISRGANGCLCGDDMVVLEGNEKFVDVSGLEGHRENQQRIVTAQALIDTHKVPANAVFHLTALHGK